MEEFASITILNIFSASLRRPHGAKEATQGMLG
jgi:hypothetical protein